MKYIKKHWFIILILIICLIRLLISFDMPSFYLRNLKYDDSLMLYQTNNILEGNYLGQYTVYTLVKGPVFPFLLAFIKYIHISYSTMFTILYIISCLFFTFSMKKIIKDDKWLLIILAILLFNPITYSSDVFQRLYRNTISITELLIFLGAIINYIFSDNHRIINGVFLGFIISIMYLTREDTIWTLFVLLFSFVCIIAKNFKNRRKMDIVSVIISIFPICILIINLNAYSFINYKYYKTYTYNELKDSSFKDAYKKVLQIKDDEKIDKVAIPKSTFYKLVENSSLLKIDSRDLDLFFKKYKDENGEINNGNIVWYFRNLMNYKHYFNDGDEANRFFKKLVIDIDNMFEKGIFEKELVSPSVYLYMPTKNELLDIPKSVIKSVIYTSSYKDIKTLTKSDILSYDYVKYDEENSAYSMAYTDYRNSADIPKHNPIHIEIIRILYKYFTIIFSFVALFLFVKNIRKKDKINILNIILIICYALIIGGISYNNATAFPSIRYSYLADIYIIQSLFIIINIYRSKKIKKYLKIK